MKSLFSLLIFTVIPLVATKRYYLVNREVCQDCAYHGGSSQWCATGSNGGMNLKWQYCSQKPGYSARGTKCATNKECNFHGYDYMWCWVDGGSWDYCGIVEDNSVVDFTNDGRPCQAPCRMDSERSLNFTCPASMDRFVPCSPLRGLSWTGVGCKGGHFELGDYCGRGYPQEDKSVFRMVGAERWCDWSGVEMERLQVKVRHIRDNETVVTAIYGEEKHYNRLRGVQGILLKDVYHAIKNILVGRKQKNETIRLDRGEHVRTENHGEFQVWQLNMVHLQQMSMPATVAQVFIPKKMKGYGRQDWRAILMMGMYHSLLRRAPVWIFQQELVGAEKLICSLRNGRKWY